MFAKRNVYIYLIIGVLMSSVYGCSGEKFGKYSSKDPELKITLEYIPGWKYSEDRGSHNSYVQAIFYPVRKGNNSGPVMSVLMQTISSLKFKPATVEAAAKDVIAKRMKFKDAVVQPVSKMQILGTEAEVIELSYMAVESLVKINSKVSPFKEKILIFQKGDKIYYLGYRSPAEEFVKFESAFTHMVNTLRFKSK
jgi:hypothetical protein